MIKTLMTKIRECVTQGVTTLPLKKESRPEIHDRGGTRNDERGIGHIARRATEQLKGGETSRHQDLSVNGARFEETQNKKVTGDYMSLL
jgi:hypothetical protein